MTIHLATPIGRKSDGRVLGFIDVLRHEKFLSNMLAGVGGIDCLLVVACDDGVMAQTREHLQILQLMGGTSSHRRRPKPIARGTERIEVRSEAITALDNWRVSPIPKVLLCHRRQ